MKKNESEKEKKPHNRIAKLRKDRGLTIQQVADGIGVSNGTISRYEKGTREPKLETWFKLSDYFNVPVSYLQGIGNSRNYEENVNTFKQDLYESISENLKGKLKVELPDKAVHQFAAIFIEGFVDIFDAAIKNVDMGTYLKDRYVSLAKNLKDVNEINNINAMVTRGIMLALEGEQDPIAEKKFREILKIIFSYNFSDNDSNRTEK
ncbi:helix-turn-helix domain-containing protein [Limosilactobacillus reuteri]|uniref:helix-turn-helix domain-containing protein n=2 Tax=Limosilactobacillus reuteri TaxID=1598 RepID=UPI002B0581A2|nr:helix-turn-helix transcriptional regulator [Limosilactobacillus reuteri]